MSNVLILDSKERIVCDEIIEQANIESIYISRKEYWLKTIEEIAQQMEKIKDENGNSVQLNLREILALAAGYLVYVERKLIDEIEKLSYDSKPFKCRRAYQKLEKLIIYISGVKLNLEKKILFLILGKISEEQPASG